MPDSNRASSKDNTNADAAVSRREFLQTAGALIVTFALPMPGMAASSSTAGPWPAKVPADRVESWIAVNADGTVAAAVGKIEAGMGISTAFAQIVAEELDVPLARVSLRMGDTATTPDQRGTGSSNGSNWKPVRGRRSTNAS